MSTVKIDFGKFKGHTLEELFEKDFGYFKWLKNLDACDIDKEEFEKFEYDEEDTVIYFGRFKYSRVSEIYKNQKKYFEWLSSKEWEIQDLNRAIEYYKNLNSVVQ